MLPKPPAVKAFDLHIGFAAPNFAEFSANYTNLLDEGIVVVAAKGIQAAQIVAQLVDTVQVSYKIISKKHFYIEAKIRLVTQLFLFAKKLVTRQKLPDQSVSLFVQIFSDYKGWWMGMTTDLKFALIRDGNFIIPRLKPMIPQRGQLFFLGHIPQNTHEKFFAGDQFVVMTRQLATSVNQKQLLNTISDSNNLLSQSAVQVIELAQKRRQGEYALAIVSRTQRII